VSARTNPDSCLCGNDESVRTETCTASFPRKWESRNLTLRQFLEMTETERTGFPPAREW
ncbi:LOW QUALITY PROTEIN: conserved hypothetical protein, partial [Neisseria gonorrhoeae SK-92-679]